MKFGNCKYKCKLNPEFKMQNLKKLKPNTKSKIWKIWISVMPKYAGPYFYGHPIQPLKQNFLASLYVYFLIINTSKI